MTEKDLPPKKCHIIDVTKTFHLQSENGKINRLFEVSLLAGHSLHFNQNNIPIPVIGGFDNMMEGDKVDGGKVDGGFKEIPIVYDDMKDNIILMYYKTGFIRPLKRLRLFINGVDCENQMDLETRESKCYLWKMVIIQVFLILLYISFFIWLAIICDMQWLPYPFLSFIGCWACYTIGYCPCFGGCFATDYVKVKVETNEECDGKFVMPTINASVMTKAERKMNGHIQTTVAVLDGIQTGLAPLDAV
eukprot:508815_1